MSNFHKMFNSQTITGRANVAKATYASFAVLYVMHRLRKRSKATPPAAAQSVTEDISTTSTREVVGDIKENTESAGEVRATSSDDFGGEEGFK